ncbi:type II toxin-antitoxin system YafQ family toxin [Parapedobacter indicus]|uniref:type II toxin-antitoxin system YafQ family toxin n=1 Tax=Parapedobacter indicus TaxID=1477437 RepID=UPI000B81A051
MKRLKKRSQTDFDLLHQLVSVLVEQGHRGIATKYRPHKLKGDYSGYWECHVKPDLLLIWDENDKIRSLELVRTGTYSDLFG